MILNLKSVFLEENSKKDFECSLSMSDIDIGGVFPFVSPVMVKGEAVNKAGLVDIYFDVTFTYCGPCDRCYKEVSRVLNYQFSHRLVVSLEGDDNDDYIETPDFTLDVDELIRSDIILNLPVKYLCNEDCRGICPKCGKDLNEGPCDCQPEADPRLAVLKQLLKGE